jgi:hypothetical protein
MTKSHPIDSCTITELLYGDARKEIKSLDEFFKKEVKKIIGPGYDIIYEAGCYGSAYKIMPRHLPLFNRIFPFNLRDGVVEYSNPLSSIFKVKVRKIKYLDLARKIIAKHAEFCSYKGKPFAGKLEVWDKKLPVWFEFDGELVLNDETYDRLLRKIFNPNFKEKWVVYVTFPYSDDPVKRTKQMEEIRGGLHQIWPEETFFIPHCNFGEMEEKFGREHAMSCCREFVRRCDKLFVILDEKGTIAPGMKDEILVARVENKPIFYVRLEDILRKTRSKP